MKGSVAYPFLNALVEHLDLAPVWTQDEPHCAIWLDGQNRPNCCCVRDYLPNSPLLRVSINKKVEMPAQMPTDSSPWNRMSHQKPDWRFELTCLARELVPFANWLAAIVNRREGRIARLPEPPFGLLNWSDISRLDDYLYYLASASIWSENAFSEDIKWWRQQSSKLGSHSRFLTIPTVAH